MAASARRWWRFRAGVGSGSLRGAAVVAWGGAGIVATGDCGSGGGIRRRSGRGRGRLSGSLGRGAVARARRRWRRDSKRLHGGAVLALDPATVAQQRGQRLEGHGLGGLPLGRVGELAGGEQVGQQLRLQPIGALLAPHAADGGLGSLVLVQVARAPGREPQRLVALELGRVLVRQEEEGPPAQAVADAVEGGAGLAGFGWRGRRSGRRSGARSRIGRARGWWAWLAPAAGPASYRASDRLVKES